MWWGGVEYEESRKEHADSVRNRESPLKIEMAKHISSATDQMAKSKKFSGELTWLRQAVIDGAITTNYDQFLELLFPEFQVFVGQDELLFAEPQGVGEIYKIHGSVEQPDSLVITENDFVRFEDRNPYLAAKLLTVFVEHPVIFVGYSLSDKNVTDILVSISRILTNENLPKLQDRLIFVTWDPDADDPELVRTAIAVEGFTIPVMTITVPDFANLFEVLAKLQGRFPAKLLRQLKQHVYELVLTNDPNGRLYVQDIDADTDLGSIDVVLGVGVGRKLSEQGYVGLSRHDLLTDVLEPASSYNAQRIVRESLPQILRQPGNTPIYRYLRQAGMLDTSGVLKPDVEVDRRVRSRVERGLSPLLLSQQRLPRQERRVKESGGSLSGLVAANTLTDALVAAPALARDSIDLGELRQFLSDNAAAFLGPQPQPSAWSKLVCLYDYYAFGPGAETNEGVAS